MGWLFVGIAVFAWLVSAIALIAFIVGWPERPQWWIAPVALLSGFGALHIAEPTIERGKALLSRGEEKAYQRALANLDDTARDWLQSQIDPGEGEAERET